eukprot:scaffold14029_cov121-Isochrysis_galbana.AAC.10
MSEQPRIDWPILARASPILYHMPISENRNDDNCAIVVACRDAGTGGWQLPGVACARLARLWSRSARSCWMRWMRSSSTRRCPSE